MHKLKVSNPSRMVGGHVVELNGMVIYPAKVEISLDATGPDQVYLELDANVEVDTVIERVSVKRT